MYKIVIVLCFTYQALSQPVTNEPSIRHARELIECCPCPGSRDGGQDMLGISSQFARSDSLDDCPCRPRSADSEGASSIFFPSAVRADGPTMKSNDPKDDAKNLLEPEVTLATSMLDTLREATEEEYRDALARDAARSATDSNTVPEESARNVVIIVNPRGSDDDEDILAEASNTQESRCVHPLENVNLEKVSSSATRLNPLSETSKFQKLKRPRLSHRNLLLFDNNVETSNVEESRVTDDSKKIPLFFARTPMFKLPTPLRSLLDNRDKDILFKNPSTNTDKMNENQSNVFKNLKFSQVPKLKSHKNTISNYDLSSAPSNELKQSLVPDNRNVQLAKPAQLPLKLKNLLKLKDVEFIPKSIRNKLSNKPTLSTSKLAIPSLITNQNEINFKNQCDEKVININNSMNVEDDNSTDINLVPKHFQPFNQVNKDPIFASGQNVFKDWNNDSVDSEKNVLDIWPSPSQFNPRTTEPDTESDKEAIYSTDIIESISDVNDLELKKLSPDLKKQPEQIENEIIIETYLPKITEVLNNKNNSQHKNLINGNALQSEILNKDYDSDTDSSNSIATLAPLETQERSATNLLPQNQDNTINFKSLHDPDQYNTQNVEDALNSENVTKDTKMRSGVNNDNITNQNEKENKSNGSQDLNDDESYRMTTDIVDPKSTNGVKRISMKDLQDMSDHLLNLHSVNHNDRSSSESDGNCIENDDVKPMLKDLDNDMNNEKCDNDIKKIENDDSTRFIDTDFTNAQNSENEALKLKSQDSKQTEMETGASDNIIKTIPGLFKPSNSNLMSRSQATEDTVCPSNDPLSLFGEPSTSTSVVNKGMPTLVNFKEASPLFDKIAVQPRKNPLTLLRKPLEDVLNLNTNWPHIGDFQEQTPLLGSIGKPFSDKLKFLHQPLTPVLSTNLPTLADLQEHLANIFNNNDRSAEEESSSFESGYTNETPVEVMAPEASTTNFHTKLPSLKRLEDFDVNIFRNELLIDDLPKPRLNSRFNSYRGSDLAFKPEKNRQLTPKTRAGVGRSSLNLEPDRKTTTRKSKPSNLVVKPLKALPSADEMRNTLRSNTRNLLSKSEQPNLNFFADNLRSHDIENIAETIRLNAHKTMKGLQQKMKSTLKKTKTDNLVSDPFAKQQEILDDVHDKLKGLHYDLNDRLSSFHDDIMDSTKLKSLFDQPRKTPYRNVMTNLRQLKARQPPGRLQSSASTITPKEVNFDCNKFKNNDNILNQRPHNNIIKVWNESPKVQTSEETILKSAKAEIPIQENPSPSKLQKTPRLIQIPSVKQFLEERKLLSSSLREPTDFDDIRPIFRTKGNPFINEHQPNKVTISFGTTTATPILSQRPILRSRVPPTISQNFKEHTPTFFSSIPSDSAGIKNSPLYNRLKLFEDTKVSPSEFKPLQISSPVTSSYDEEFEDSTENFSTEGNQISNLKPPVLREMPNYKTPKIQSNLFKPKSATIFGDNKELAGRKFLSDQSVWPKAPENSFLSKVRKTVNIGSSNLDHTPVKDVEIDLNSDNLRSASRNSDIILDEPLKENVSYRCRMVCTKEVP